MHSRLNRSAIIALCCVVGTLLDTSYARAAVGDGVRAGNFQLKLGLSLTSGVNTNLFFEDDGGALAPRVEVVPRVELESVDLPNFQFDLGWSFNWTQYISDSIFISSQSGLSTDLTARATINPKGAWSLTFRDTLGRTNEPTNSPSTIVYNRLNNDLGVSLGIHPGGRVIQGFINYDWQLRTYAQIAGLNNNQHRASARFIYRFLPKTTLQLNGDMRFISYDSVIRAVSSTAGLPNNNSSPIRVKGGLSGLLTKRVAITLFLGYGWGRYVAGPDVSGWTGLLAQTEASYFFGAKNKSAVRLGYERGFDDAQVGNFYNFDRGYVALAHRLFGDKLSLEAAFGVERRTTNIPDVDANIPVVGGEVRLPPTLTDLFISGKLDVSYSFARWFDVGAQYQLASSITDDNVTVVRGTPNVGGRGFLRHIVLLKADLRY